MCHPALGDPQPFDATLVISDACTPSVANTCFNNRTNVHLSTSREESFFPNCLDRFRRLSGANLEGWSTRREEFWGESPQPRTTSTTLQYKQKPNRSVQTLRTPHEKTQSRLSVHALQWLSAVLAGENSILLHVSSIVIQHYC